jgi:nitrogen regulatory protein P-II 2
MHIKKMKLVTIIAESVITEKLQEDLIRMGASGYTTTKAEGRGSRGVRASDWEGRNSKIETIVTEEIADRILDRLADHYFEYYAVIAYAHAVEVVRGEKFA